MKTFINQPFPSLLTQLLVGRGSQVLYEPDLVFLKSSERQSLTEFSNSAAPIDFLFFVFSCPITYKISYCCRNEIVTVNHGETYLYICIYLIYIPTLLFFL